MQRSSQQDQDGIIWTTAPLPLGTTGLDLRTPTSPGSLTKLLNARFRDETTVERRLGFSGLRVQDSDDFALGVNTPTGWLYGHGQLLDGLGDAHYPQPRAARGTFHYDNNDLVWTGDRLLVTREGDPFIGASEFWSRGAGETLHRGIPAYLPVQTDAAPPDVVTGNHVETCVTDDLRVVIASSANEDLIAWVIHRETGAVIDRTEIVTAASAVYEPRVINSGGIPVAVWLNGTELTMSWWTGVRWTTPSAVTDAVYTFEVAESPGGFTLAWRTGTTLKVGQYAGQYTDNTNFAFGSTLDTNGVSARDGLAVAVAPNGCIGVIYVGGAGYTLYASTYGPDLTGPAYIELDDGPWDNGLACCFRAIDDGNDRYNLVIHAASGATTRIWELVHDYAATPATYAFAVHTFAESDFISAVATTPGSVANGWTLTLQNDAGGPDYFEDGTAAIYHGTLFSTKISDFLGNTAGSTYFVTAGAVASGGGILPGFPTLTLAGGTDAIVEYSLAVLQTDSRYNTELASKSFRIGDEVFCWLRAANSQTNYLIGGVTRAQVCGICDREESTSRSLRGDHIKGLPMVYVTGDYTATWIRPYTTSRVITIDAESKRVADLYNRAGNCRIGDLNFMPKLSAVAYGESVYVAGSHVRNWDGMELGDAGFNDYPTVRLLSQSNGAGSLATGTYMVRVYAVRYNKRGERFQSPAITDQVTITPGNNTLLIYINAVPCTNHDDVMFEVWRTEVGGTTFYLDGAVANSLAVDNVQYTCTISDAVLRTRAADPHAPGIGFLAEVEELGPLGCEVLVAAGDRLWACGGQVPPGRVQFSKLKEPGEGAGFDVLFSTQQVDITGAAINSIAAFGDTVVFFQKDGLGAVNANGGPDNYGQGDFGVPQLVLADGAITHHGTVVTPIGPVFWGADGPRLLQHNFTVEQICAPVRELSRTLTPSGVQVDYSRQEVVWFTEEGTALLWNYRSVESKFGQLNSMGRWAQWSGLNVAGCSQYALATTDGRILYEDEEALGDDGVPFEHAGATGYLAPGAILGGATHVRAVGVNGEFLGEHKLRVKVYFNGSPMWSLDDAWEWEPAEEVGHLTGEELAALDAAGIDALEVLDRSGAYATHKKLSRHSCRHFRVEWTDIGAFRPTYRLHELTLELGARGGMGRVAVSNFGG